MNYLSSKLKKFDVHIKAVDGVNQQTILGAIFTIITFILTILLIFSEIKLYLTKNSIHHMVVDQKGGLETVRLDFDFEFHAISCTGLISLLFNFTF